MDPLKLGIRVKNFRKSKNISQVQLETEIGAAPGSLSRIEAGKVVPTLLTIQRIINVLGLNTLEASYLHGKIFHPADKEQIDHLRNFMKPYFSLKETIAYVIDDRYFLIYASDTMTKLMGYTPESAYKLYGISLIEMMIKPEYGIRKFLDEDDFDELLEYQFSLFENEVAFMKDDEAYKRIIYIIKNDKQASRAYQKVKDEEIFFSTRLGRQVSFKFGPLKVRMEYTTEAVQVNPRFRLIEYIPTNKFVRLLLGSQKSEVGSRESGVRSQESGVRKIIIKMN